MGKLIRTGRLHHGLVRMATLLAVLVLCMGDVALAKRNPRTRSVLRLHPNPNYVGNYAENSNNGFRPGIVLNEGGGGEGGGGGGGEYYNDIITLGDAPSTRGGNNNVDDGGAFVVTGGYQVSDEGGNYFPYSADHTSTTPHSRPPYHPHPPLKALYQQDNSNRVTPPVSQKTHAHRGYSKFIPNLPQHKSPLPHDHPHHHHHHRQQQQGYNPHKFPQTHHHQKYPHYDYTPQQDQGFHHHHHHEGPPPPPPGYHHHEGYPPPSSSSSTPMSSYHYQNGVMHHMTPGFTPILPTRHLRMSPPYHHPHHHHAPTNFRGYGNYRPSYRNGVQYHETPPPQEEAHVSAGYPYFR